MFVIQVDFNDGISEIESVLIRRLYVKIGTSESSHLILDGIPNLPYELSVIRGLGSKFKCKANFFKGQKVTSFSWEKEYDSISQIELGPVTLTIVSVPAQIAEKDSKSDQLSKSSNILTELAKLSQSEENKFPALFSLTEPRVAISVGGVEKVSIGNSRHCLFRSEYFRSKQEYAVIQFGDGVKFKNLLTKDNEQILINGEHISNRKKLEPKDRIKFSSGLELMYLSSENDLNDVAEEFPDIFLSSSKQQHRNIRSISGPIVPDLLPVRVGQTISIGRDASHNIWIDAAFISRLHSTIYVESDGYVITDFSTNGVKIAGERIEKGKQVFIGLNTTEISFGHGATILLSELDDNGFERYLNGEKQSNISSDLDANLMRDFPVENPEPVEDKIEKPIVESIEKEPALEEAEISFAEYQKRSVRLLEESGSQFLTENLPNFDDDSLRTEFPTRIGITRYLPHIFIAALIITIVTIFVLLGSNLVH